MALEDEDDWFVYFCPSKNRFLNFKLLKIELKYLKSQECKLPLFEMIKP